MSGTGSSNTPAQPSVRVDSRGNMTDLGGTSRVVAGQDPVDASASGAAAADTGIDPATGLPKAAPVVDPNKPAETPAVKTPEELAAEAAALKNAPKEAPKPGTPTPEELEAAKAEAAKTDPRFVPFTEEFMTTGDISSENRDKAAKDFGVSRSIVDAWVEGQKATKQVAGAAATVDQVAIDRTVATVKGLIGTEQEYTAFQTWANANLPAGDMATLTYAIDTGNPGIYKLAMNDAKAKWQAAGGQAPRDLTNGGQNQPGTAAAGFASLVEQTNYINDPKWRNDPEYRRIGEARIGNSRF